MPESNEKPPARPIFRKLSWVIAAVNFLMALVAVTGFMGDDNRFWMTLIFLFCGLVFTTIALTGYWSAPAAKEAVTGASGSPNLILAIICMLFFVQGIDEVVKPNFVNRLLGGLQIVTGSVGMIAGVMAYLQQRKQAKQQESGK